MAVTAWVASHTGLPSFHVTADERVTTGERVLRALSGPTLVSDALAAPGVATTYLVGSEQVTLSRAAAAFEGLVTDCTGRGVRGLISIGNGDPLAWSAGVSRFNTRVARWPIETPAMTGSTTFLLEDPAREAEVWDTLQRRSQIILGPARPTPGVPLRPVTVDSVARTRVGGDGESIFQVAWTQAIAVVGAAPVVTWGEWAAVGQGWQALSALQVAQLVAGMPS